MTIFLLFFYLWVKSITKSVSTLKVSEKKITYVKSKTKKCTHEDNMALENLSIVSPSNEAGLTPDTESSVKRKEKLLRKSKIE